MLIEIILCFSVFFQLAAVFYALRYIKTTRHVFSWILISAALIIMIVRRVIPLYGLIVNSVSYPVIFQEWLGLILSVMMFLGVKGIGRIFIERLENEKKISYLATFPELSPNPICEIDKNGNVTYKNPAALEFDKKGICYPCNLSPEEIKDIYSKKDEDRVSQEKKCGDKWYFQTIQFIPRTGSVRFYNIDITERKKAEEELMRYKNGLENIVREKTEELKKTYKELEDGRRLYDIGMLAATIAHELRNPLGVIKFAVYNIKRKSNDHSLDSQLANIDKKIEESDLIIRNLLTYSRIKTPHYEEVPICEVLKLCICNCQSKYSKYDVQIDIKSNCASGYTIEADSLHINELFSNILDNAYQSFADKKGIIEINIDCDQQKKMVIVIFRDNGTGIDKADLPKIATPFFTTKARGIGLGLAVCKQVVNLHKGEFNIESVKDKGTTVMVLLPIRKKI